MRPLNFREGLASGPMLLDAAMGTRLVARGLDLATEDPCLWCVTRPDVVDSLHARDALAGSDAVVTNTFGANRLWLARYGQSEYTVAINRIAVMVARIATDRSRFVIGGMGPTAVYDTSVYREQAEALLIAGVDALMLETHDAEAALLGLRNLGGLVGDVPILVGLFQSAPIPDELAPRLIDLGATAIGGNCQDGMAPALALAVTLRRQTDAPLIAKPGGGLPGNPPASPESFAAAVPALLTAGVRLFGGCCGTTEEHVLALRRALDEQAALALSPRPADRL